MSLNLMGQIEGLKQGIDEVKGLLNLGFCDDGEKIVVERLSEAQQNSIEIHRGENNYIKYKNTNDFFRALSLYVQFVNQGKDSFHKEEKKHFENSGVMLDVSRNAVYKVQEVKNILGKMALMGHNRFMLYTEDTYEIKKYPYFGHLRGRYTKEELKEIDDYAYALGIEVIPCIQTLAHLKQALKWEYAEDFKDTQDILMVGNDKTYELVEAMIATLSETFRSRNIHIGMDEAMDLGRGKYINRNGYKSQYELMLEHLSKVCDITRKYGLKPMMWDDMFFRAASPNHEYYELDTVISEEVINKIPEDISLVYWDYYHNEEYYYGKLLEIREKFNNPVIFAGGVWKWMGFAPHYQKTMVTTNAALTQCKEKGIKEVFATAWGDDGAETPVETIDLGLILYAEHAYNEKVEEAWLEERCKAITGLSVEDFMAMEELDLIPTVKQPNLPPYNPSKYLLYQDILSGAFDKHVEGLDLKRYYESLTEKYDKLAKKSTAYQRVFELYSKLSAVLTIKASLGLEIRAAYLKGDKDHLKNIANSTLPELIIRLDSFHTAFKNVWFNTSKAQGFEVNDIRVGGVKERAKTSLERINLYLEGKIDKIEELEDEPLFFNTLFGEEGHIITFNQYGRIASQNVLTW